MSLAHVWERTDGLLSGDVRRACDFGGPVNKGYSPLNDKFSWVPNYTSFFKKALKISTLSKDVDQLVEQ